MLIDKCRKEIILVDNKWYLDGVKDIILDMEPPMPLPPSPVTITLLNSFSEVKKR